jgi:outer membrane lipoprotein-sorting protein
MPSSLRSRRIRWAAPILVVAVIGLVALVPTLSAGATPSLPSLSPQQLIDKVQQSNVQALSGTIRLTTSLGLPDLGSLAGAVGRGSGFNPIDLLTGSHEARVWFDGPDRQRVALLSSLAESDVIHNGPDLWTWQSEGSRVTHSHTAAPAAPTAPVTRTPGATAETPDQVASMLLGQLTPSTDVSVSTTAYVAGRAAYELVLSPRAPESTVSHVTIAVDAKTGLPLRVGLFAKAQAKAAFEVGFTSVSFSRPAASTFAFKPPPGATVTTNTAAPGAHAEGGAKVRIKAGETPATATGPTGQTPPETGQSQTVGHDWTTVLITSAGSQLPSPATGRVPDQASNAVDQLYRLRRAATPLKGTNDRLLHTALINVLLLPDGRIAVGAVTPEALVAATAPAP